MSQSTVNWADPEIAAMRAKWVKAIEEEISQRWLDVVSEAELNRFLQ